MTRGFRSVAWLLSFAVALLLTFVASCDPEPEVGAPKVPLKPWVAPTTPCPKTPTPSGVPVEAATARTIADTVARAELCKQVREMQKLDTRIELRLADYEVRMTEAACTPGALCLFSFEFVFERSDPLLARWKDRHPLHFGVQVRKTDGSWELFPGT